MYEKYNPIDYGILIEFYLKLNNKKMIKIHTKNQNSIGTVWVWKNSI